MQRRTFLKLGALSVGSGIFVPLRLGDSCRVIDCSYPEGLFNASPAFAASGNAFAKAVEECSFGKLRIHLVPAREGTRTPLSLSSPSLNTRLDPFLSFPVRATPLGVQPDQKRRWLSSSGGDRFLQEVYAGTSTRPLHIGLAMPFQATLVRTSRLNRSEFWKSTRWQAMGWEQSTIHRLAGIPSLKANVAELPGMMFHYQIDALSPSPATFWAETQGWMGGGWWTCMVESQLASPPVHVIESDLAFWNGLPLKTRLLLEGAAVETARSTASLMDLKLEETLTKIVRMGGKVRAWPADFSQVLTEAQGTLRGSLLQREPRLASAFQAIGEPVASHSIEHLRKIALYA